MTSKKYITRRKCGIFYVLDHPSMYITFCEAHRVFTPFRRLNMQLRVYWILRGRGDAVVKRIRWGDENKCLSILRLNFYNDDYTSNTQGERG